MIIPNIYIYIWKNKIHVPNQQPGIYCVYMYIYIYIYITYSSGYNYSITWYNYDYNFHKLGDVGYNGV